MTTALIVIDVQNIYTAKDAPLLVSGNAKTVENINKLIEFHSRAKHLIVYVRHVHKKDPRDLGRMFDFSGSAEEPNFLEGTKEVEYDSRLTIAKTNAIHLIKNRYSAFSNPEFGGHLKKNNISNIVISGFMTDYCCESTAREAHDLDYYVDFIIDATGCPDASDEIDQKLIKKVSGAVLSGGFARIFSTKNYLSQMSKGQKAGS